MPYAHTDNPVDPKEFLPGKRYYFERFGRNGAAGSCGREFSLTNEDGDSTFCVEHGSSWIEGRGDWVITEDDETAKPSPHTVPLTIRVPLDRVSAVAEEFEVIGTP